MLQRLHAKHHVLQGFISECKAMDKPFMLYFNPTTPHDPDVYTALFNFTLLDTPAGNDIINYHLWHSFCPAKRLMTFLQITQ